MNHLVTGGARRSPSGTPAVPSSLSLPAAIADQGVGQPEWTARLHQASALRGPGGRDSLLSLGAGGEQPLARDGWQCGFSTPFRGQLLSIPRETRR